MNGRLAQLAWEAKSVPEIIQIVEFQSPSTVRRHKRIAGAVAELLFDDNEIVLSIIAAEKKGAGSELIEEIKAIADEFSLAISGNIAAIRVVGWPSNPSHDFAGLIRWYEQRGFLTTPRGMHCSLRYPKL